ncbi:PIN domain-containing protein [Arthrobacter sp. efr-133-TYG-120]|uniref:PIN domain-containing protein n=1 Tax=Arthrobacter sp. efr-133-TYG-120 TaxID=3040280 RepID=UPI00254E3585|nr:PIN domain-containing protein [Arthrobacter sp. efr-133-TYG-120]
MTGLRATASPGSVLTSLSHLRGELENIQSGPDQPSEWRKRYIYWTNEASRLLRGQIRQAQLEHLVTSHRYWTLLSMDVLGVNEETDRLLVSVIRTEVRERITEFDAAIKSLEQELDLWKNLDAPVVAVLDTNVLHEHHDQLSAFPWNERLDLHPNRDLLLVVPIAVVDELDNQKLSNQKSADGTTPLRTRARAALKTLDGLLQPDTVTNLAKRSVPDGCSAVYIRLLNNDLEHGALDDADSEIIDRALTLQPFSREVLVVTYDSAMAFRARHFGLKATKLRYD